jgi:EcsC protein family
MSEAPGKALQLAERAVTQILNVGIDGAGPFKGAIEVAEEVYKSTGGDVEVAIRRLVRVHVRLAATNGAVTGLGGLLTLPVTVPVGLGGYYLLGARLVAGIAHLRGHDIHSEDVRTAVLLVMLGSAGTEILKDVGVEIGTKGLAAALKKVPGALFIQINKKVGFRMVTKGGTNGVINAGKLVPLIGAPIGGTVDGLSMRGVARYARSAFPEVPGPLGAPETA